MESVSVSIRIRPLNGREKQSNAHVSWDVDQNNIVQCSPSGRPISAHCYAFDNIFAMDSTTKRVYQRCARPIVDATMAGMHGTIFAYGQTSSGKTHTMMGEPGEGGIIPLAIQDIFNIIEQTPDREYLLRVSFMEIYNEVITDLLAPDNTNLKIHETSERDIYVGGLTEEVVCSPEEILRHMQLGQKNRKTGSTRMNDRSSRSHTVFRVVVESRECSAASSSSTDTAATGTGEVGGDDGNTGSRQSLDGGGAVRVAHLNLVDLAGSERVSLTGAEGMRLKEGAHINKSLLTLGTCIAKLSDGVTSETGHIPYRDAKLTRILQNSLGGNARTAIICTITPASLHLEESISTLKFASRAKTIKNTAVVNEVYDDAAMLRKMKREINQLKHRNQLLEDGTELQTLKTEKQCLEEALKKRDAYYQRQAAQLDKLKRVIITSTTAHSIVGAPAPVPKDRKTRRNRRKTWCSGLSEESVAKRSLGLLFSPAAGSSKAKQRQRSLVVGGGAGSGLALSAVASGNAASNKENEDSTAKNGDDGASTSTGNDTSGAPSASAGTSSSSLASAPCSAGRDTGGRGESTAAARRKRSLLANGVPRLKTAQDTMASFKRKARARRSLASTAANLELMGGLMGSSAGAGGAMSTIPEEAAVGTGHEDGGDSANSSSSAAAAAAGSRAVPTRADIFKAKAQRLQRDLSTKQEEVARLEAELAAAREQLGSRDERVQRLEAELKSLHETFDSQHAHVEALEGRLAEQQQHFEVELSEARENTGFIQHELEILRESHEQDQADASKLRKDMSCLQTKYDEQTKELSTAQGRCEQLQEQVASQDTRISELVAEVERTRADAKDSAKEELKAEMDAVRLEAEQAQTHRQEKEDALCELEIRFTSTARKLEEMTRALDQLRGDGADKAKDSHKEEGKRLEAELAGVRTTLKSMQEMLDVEMPSGQPEQHDGQQATDADESSITTDASESTTTAGRSSSRSSDMVLLGEALLSAVSQLQKELHAANTNTQAQAKEVAQLQCRVDAADNEKDETDAYLRSLQEQLADVQREERELKAALEERGHQLQAKTTESEEVAAKLEEVKANMEQIQQKQEREEQRAAEEKEAAVAQAAADEEALRVKAEDDVRAEMEAFYIAQQQELTTAHEKRVQELRNTHQQQLRAEAAKLEAMQAEVEALVTASESQTQSQEEAAAGMSGVSKEEHERALEEAKAAFEAQMSELKQSHEATLQQEKESHEEALANLKAQMTALQGEHDEIKQQATAAAKQVEELQAAMKEAKESRDEAERALESELSLTRAELMEMEAERDALNYEYTLVQARASQLQQSVKTLHEQLQSLQASSGENASAGGTEHSTHALDAETTAVEKSAATHKSADSSSSKTVEDGNVADENDNSHASESDTSSSSSNTSGRDNGDVSPKRKGDSRRHGRRKRKKRLGGRGELTSPTTLVAPPKSGFRSLVSKLMTPIRRGRKHRKEGKDADTAAPKTQQGGSPVSHTDLDDSMMGSAAAATASGVVTPARRTPLTKSTTFSPTTPAPSTPLIRTAARADVDGSHSGSPACGKAAASAGEGVVSPKNHGHNVALSTRFETLTAAHTALQEAHANLDAQLRAAKEQVTVSQERVSELEAETQGVSERLAETERKREETQGALAQAQEEHASTVKELEEQLASLRAEHTQATQSKAELEQKVTELKQAEERASSLLSQADEASTRLQTLSEENTELASYVEELESVNERLLNQLEKMQQELEEAHAAAAATVASAGTGSVALSSTDPAKATSAMAEEADDMQGHVESQQQQLEGTDHVKGLADDDSAVKREEGVKKEPIMDIMGMKEAKEGRKEDGEVSGSSCTAMEATQKENKSEDVPTLSREAARELQEDHDALETQVRELEKQLEKQQAAFASQEATLAGERDTASQRVEGLITALTRARNELQSLSTARQALAEQVAELQTQHTRGVDTCVQQVCQRIARYEEGRRNEDAQKQQHQQEKAQQEEASKRMQEAAREAGARATRLEAELAAAKEQAVACKQEHNELAARLEEAEARAQQAEAASEEEQAKITEELTVLQEEVDGLCKERDDLQGAANEKQAELREELKQTHAEHKQSLEEVASLKKQVEQLSSDLTASELAKEDAVQKCQSLEEEHERLRQQLEKRRQEAVAALSKAQDGASAQVRELQEQRTALEQQVRVLKKRADDQVRMLDTARDSKLEMEVELEHARTASREHKEKAQQLQGSLTEAQEKLQAGMAASQEQLSTLRKQLEEVVAAQKEAEARAQGAEEEKAKLEATCASLRKSSQRASRKLKKMTAAASCDDYWQKQAEELKAHVERLQQEAAAASDLRASTEALQKEASAAREAQGLQEGETNKAKAALKAKQRELHKLQLKVDTIQAHNEQLQTKLRSPDEATAENDAPGQVGQTANYELKEKNKRLVKQLEEKQAECQRFAKQLKLRGYAHELSALDKGSSAKSSCTASASASRLLASATPLSMSTASTIKDPASANVTRRGAEFAGMLTSTPDPKSRNMSRTGARVKDNNNDNNSSSSSSSTAGESQSGYKSNAGDVTAQNADKGLATPTNKGDEEQTTKRSKSIKRRAVLGELQKAGADADTRSAKKGRADAKNEAHGRRYKCEENKEDITLDDDDEESNKGNTHESCQQEQQQATGTSDGFRLSLNASTMTPQRYLYEQAKKRHRREKGEQEVTPADQCNQQ